MAPTACLLPPHRPPNTVYVDGRRLLAIREDARSERLVGLAQAWQSLASGASRIEDYFSTTHRHYLVLGTPPLDAPQRRPNPTMVHILERALLGHTQKRIAIERNIAPSTVACAALDALHSMGVRASASRAPLVLAHLVHAHHGLSDVLQGRVSDLSGEGQPVRVLSTARFDVPEILSPAEQEVVRLRAEGWSHAEIASKRNSSRRTVANQLASASRKLGVSGRPELMSYFSTRPSRSPDRGFGQGAHP